MIAVCPNPYRDNDLVLTRRCISLLADAGYPAVICPVFADPGDEVLPPEHGQLEHGADALAGSLCQDRRLGSGQLVLEIAWIIVAQFLVLARHVVVYLDGAGIEVGAGALKDPVMEPLEGILRDGVVAVEEDDVFARRLVDAGVAGGGARSAARPGEHLEPRILRRIPAHDFFGLVLGGLNANQAFPIRERLVQHRIETFAHVGFYVAAGDDYGEKRFHRAYIMLSFRNSCGVL